MVKDSMTVGSDSKLSVGDVLVKIADTNRKIDNIRSWFLKLKLNEIFVSNHELEEKKTLLLKLIDIIEILNKELKRAFEEIEKDNRPLLNRISGLVNNIDKNINEYVIRDKEDKKWIEFMIKLKEKLQKLADEFQRQCEASHRCFIAVQGQMNMQYSDKLLDDKDNNVVIHEEEKVSQELLNTYNVIKQKHKELSDSLPESNIKSKKEFGKLDLRVLREVGMQSSKIKKMNEQFIQLLQILDVSTKRKEKMLNIIEQEDTCSSGTCMKQEKHDEIKNLDLEFNSNSEVPLQVDKKRDKHKNFYDNKKLHKSDKEEQKQIVRGDENLTCISPNTSGIEVLDNKKIIVSKISIFGKQYKENSVISSSEEEDVFRRRR